MINWTEGCCQQTNSWESDKRGRSFWRYNAVVGDNQGEEDGRNKEVEGENCKIVVKLLKIFWKRRKRSDKWPWSKKENVKQRTPLEPGCEIKRGVIVKSKILS